MEIDEVLLRNDLVELRLATLIVINEVISRKVDCGSLVPRTCLGPGKTEHKFLKICIY